VKQSFYLFIAVLRRFICKASTFNYTPSSIDFLIVIFVFGAGIELRALMHTRQVLYH
jgi:hypothetical protein